jgi:mannose-1-phosphate guanylyltransferase
MRAILLAAGFGTRLRPLTDTLPKCLVPIQGKPLLQIWLERLSSAGIGPYLANTHYLADQVEAFIKEGQFSDRVTLVYEERLLGTAGTLLANMDFFQGDDGLLAHADNYCMADLSAFMLAHQQRPAGCVMTMMTFLTDRPEACGIVELDERGVVIRMHEKVLNPPGNLANGAIYIISPAMQTELRQQLPSATDFSTEVLPHFMGRIYSYRTHSTFMDVGTPDAYALLNSNCAVDSEPHPEMDTVHPQIHVSSVR